MEKGEGKDEAESVPLEADVENTESDGPLPEYVYTREKLIDLSEVPASKARPPELSNEFDTNDGCWDPEKWIKSFHVARDDSPGITTVTGREKRRPADLDRDFTRRAIDPKERIKEERDGIILSPQRKSFGTGCHVTTSSQQRRPNSPLEYREPGERDRRNPDRRIGSGRLAMDRDRDRDFRSDRFNDRRFERYRRDSRDSDEHDNRDMRRGQRNEYEDRRFSSRRPVRRREEEQPEWFTSGPTNQLETIELRGFEDPSYDEKSESGGDTEASESKHVGKKSRGTRSESVATNESSSPDDDRSTTPEKPATPASSNDKTETQQKQEETQGQAPNGPDFDFNAFFNLETIPGLGSNQTVESEATVPQGGSRFTRWFQTNSPHNSRNGSRRSSFTDDYSYLHDLSFSDIVGGHRSPTIPSPSEPPCMFSPIPNIDDHQQQQQQSLFEMMMLNNKPDVHVPAPTQTHLARLSDRDKVTASAMEADLKALLFSGKKPELSPQQRPIMTSLIGVPTDRVKTLAELEAGVSSPPMQLQQIPQQQTPNEDMAAFNKLLGMMKASGSLPNSPQTPHKPVPLTPVSMMTPQQQQTRPDQSLHQPGPQKDMLQELLRSQQQRQIQEQQRQLQAQQHRQMQEHQQRQLHEQQQCQIQQEQKQRQIQEQKQLQQIQAKLLQHQQQQQQQQQEMLKNIIKNKPTIVTKPASPVVNLQQNQQPTTPNVPSPNILLQQPSSPRAPSPIMFGNQPPMHLSAPSPIHPTQHSTSASPTANLSVNTLQVTPGSPTSLRPSVLPRVPSPQELVFHTQAIMQNALIKKQLEDQKERFIKKQQQYDPNRKSPNPLRPGEMPGTPIAVTTQGSPSVSAAFTPTSVILKMASEKKMREESDNDSSNQQPLPQFQQQIRTSDDSNLSPPRMNMTIDQLQLSPQHVPGRPLVGQGVMNALTQQLGRPIMKTAGPGQPVVSASQNNVISAANDMAARAAIPSTPSERLNECPKSPSMNNLRTPPNMPPLPNNTTPSFLSPIPGRLPMQGSRPALVNPAAANALLVQQMMQAGMTQQNAIVAAAARVSALQNQMGMNPHMNPLATIQQQQRNIDPRMPVRAVYPSMVPGQRGGLLPNSPNALGVPNMNSRSLSPQPQFNTQFVAEGRNGPLSPGLYPKAASPNMSDSSNLTKWFGMDLLKQQLPNMPPLPAPGQRVMTVDEIERRQQVVT